MEKKESQNKTNIVIIIVFVVAIILFGGLILKNIFGDKKEETVTDSYETKQYKSFISELDSYVDNMDPNMDTEEAKMDIVSEVISLQKKYEDGDGVSYAANKLVGSASNSSGSTQNLLDTLSAELSKLASAIFNTTDPTTTLTIRSNTVCEKGDIDSKHCVEKLSAKVYITDKNSTKWAVILHGNNMTGKQMYSAVGDMYASSGYNVIAPDLRGAGDSDGSVAMGYLESLDVYDWIKDLNENWSSRYGVASAPSVIVVHGVSLGGATTLQLATNPDIASANGNGPFTKNLTQLNVKGFVDDCGYTSISGIISGLLSFGDGIDLSVISGWLGFEETDLLDTIKKEAEKLNIDGFTDIDISDITNNKEISEYLEQFSDKFNDVIEESKKYSNTYEYTIPSVDQSPINDWWNKISGTSSTATGSATATLVDNNFGSSSSSLTDTLMRKVILSLLGVGLTEDNYDKYSDSFSEGRVFPKGSNVVIIHGTADTFVSHDNSDIVANHILSTNDARLLYKWDVESAPHAFIVIGSNKDEYTNLIGNFANCTADSKYCNIFSSSDLELPLKEISK